MGARRRVRERRRLRVEQGGRPVAHGTWAAYTTDKCRCAQCRAFKAAYMKAYRARKNASWPVPARSPGQVAPVPGAAPVTPETVGGTSAEVGRSPGSGRSGPGGVRPFAVAAGGEVTSVTKRRGRRAK